MRSELLPVAIHLGAFPMDPGFPQLEVAGDPVRMLEVFRTHLKPVAGMSCRILDCTPYRFRCYQSTTRCVLQYTLRVSEPSTGREWNQWVTGLIYAEPGEAERLWQKLRAADPGVEIPGPWRTFEPMSFIPELDMVVEVFPFDRRLPQLARVLDGASRGLEPLLLARLGPGRWQAAEPAIEPRRYRTELGAVLCYSLPAREAETGRAETARCYLRVYRDQRGGETFERLRSWTQHARQGYSLVRPIAYLDEVRTLALEEAPGTSLQEFLLSGRDPFVAVRAVARAVAAFNQDDLDITPTHTTSEHLNKLRAASALVQWACPEKRAKIAGVSAVVARNLEEAPPGPLHGNLKTDRVFLSDDQVTLVGADSIARGDPVRDPAFLFAHIAGRVGLDAIPPEQAGTVAAAFVEEYFTHVPASWRKRFGLHCAGAFIEAAADVFRSQGPGWSERVAEMASNAQRASEGKFG